MGDMYYQYVFFVVIFCWTWPSVLHAQKRVEYKGLQCYVVIVQVDLLQRMIDYSIPLHTDDTTSHNTEYTIGKAEHLCYLILYLIFRISSFLAVSAGA